MYLYYVLGNQSQDRIDLITYIFEKTWMSGAAIMINFINFRRLNSKLLIQMQCSKDNKNLFCCRLTFCILFIGPPEYLLTLAIKNLVKKETLASICFGANSRHATYKKGRVYSKEICNNMELCMHYALRTKRGKRWKYLWFCSASPCVLISNVCMQYRAVGTGFARGAIFIPHPRFYRNGIKNYSFKRPWLAKGQLISNFPLDVFISTYKPTKLF